MIASNVAAPALERKDFLRTPIAMLNEERMTVVKSHRLI